MRSRHTGVADKTSIARASFVGTAVLVALAIISVTASGCGVTPVRTETPPQLQMPPQLQTQSLSATQAAEVATVTAVANGQSLHERVMAEQGRGSGAGAAINKTTTSAVTTGPQSTTSASADPPAKSDGRTSIVLTGGQTPLKGTWSGTASQLASFLLKACPSPRFTVPTSVLADYYVRYCAEAGLRADLLWAQMIHETGYGTYGGDVTPEQNNYAGLGATGDGASGVVFATAEAGVMAQLAHMVAYAYASSPVAWADEAVDPRFDLVGPRGVVSVLSDLDGRWAVPGAGYGEAIETIARAINLD
jgi:hypothetical protein